MGHPSFNIKLANQVYGNSDYRKIAKRGRRNQLFSDAAHYWSDGSLPFAYAMACTQIVLLHGKAEHSYSQVKGAWDGNDCLKAADGLIETFQNKIIPNKDWVNVLTPPSEYNNSQDFQHLISCIQVFIREGFNRQEDIDNQRWKVEASLENPWLFKAVAMWSLADAGGIKLEEWNEYKSLPHKGKVYDIENIMRNKPTDRTHRKLVLHLKKYGKLAHDRTLLDVAEKWYCCRVSPGTIEAYVNELAKDENYIDRSNVEAAIAPMDEITGYPRKWRK
jgi:hypothetical protein